ncbi:DUF3352 domain-containing protein [Patescibacteria group bacterium]
MGRKANAKKIIRELRKGKNNKESKKTKKNKKKKSSKSKKSSKQSIKKVKFQLSNSQIFGLVIALISLAAICTYVFILFQKAYRPEPIAKYLPAERTIAIAEININLEHNLTRKLFTHFEKYPQYSQETLIAFVEHHFNTNYETDLKPWLGRKIGIAILHSESAPDNLEQIYFIEATNSQKVIEYFGSPKASYSKGDINIYPFPSGNYFSFIKNYLVIGSTELSLEILINEQKSAEKLYRSQKYRRIDDNLPLNRIGFLFIDYSKVSANLLQTIPFISQSGISQLQTTPIFNLFNSHGFVLVPQDQNIIVQSFLSLNTEKLKDQKFITHDKKYQAELTAYTPENVLVFWGSSSLENQLNKILELVALGDQNQIEFFYKSMDTYAKTYFGSNINLQKDILPLFENEYAFIVENQNNQNIYKILLKLDDTEEQSRQIHQIANDFAKLGSIYEEQTVEHILEDGTYSQEIIAAPKKVVKSQSEYNGVIINELKLGSRNWGIYYSIHNDIAILSNQIQGVQSTIDVIKDKQSSIKESPIYYTNIDPLLQHSDELTYINVQGIQPFLFDDQKIPPIFDVFGTISSGKNYFNDGIVNTNYLSIK